RDLLDHGTRLRSDGQQQRLARPDRLRTAGEVGRLAERLATAAMDESVPYRWTPHSPMAARAGRTFRRLDDWRSLTSASRENRRTRMIEATIAPQTREPFVSRSSGRRTHSESTSHAAFLCASAVLFLISSTMTIIWCGSMSAMDEMPMPGGWGMSMTWMRMPEQTWLGMGASAVGMWLVMMLAMMLPCLVPMLVRYRRTIETGGRPLGQLTALVGAGYFFVWALFGV